MEVIELQAAQKREMFKCAQEGNWNGVKLFIETEAKLVLDFTGPNDGDSNKTLLHYACGAAHRDVAKEAVNMIFEQITRIGHFYDEFKQFINSEDSNGRTAFHISLQKCRYDIVDILLEKGADFWINFDSTFSHQYQKVLLKVLDKGLNLEKGEHDELDKSQWTISCNFSLITGKARKVENSQQEMKTQGEENGTNQHETAQNSETAQTSGVQTSKEIVPETQLFAQILSLPEVKRYGILMHPLVHLFVHKMCKKYKKVIWASTIFHVLWYILSASVIMGTMTSILASNTTKTNVTVSDNSTNNLAANNTSENKTTIQIGSSSFTNYIGFTILLWIFVGLTVAKEIGELVFCSSKIYHVKQMEEIAQYFVILAVIVASTVGPSAKNLGKCLQFNTSLLYSVGFLAALLLVQGQLSKTILSGVHNHMMMKGFKKLLLFMAMFVLVYIAFALFFNMLLPNDPMFSGMIVLPKVLTMQTGELNFNEIFTQENMEKKYFFIVPAVIVFTVFIIAVVSLFPIILFGLAIESITDLRNEANAAYVASRLELANVLETCFVFAQKWLPEKVLSTSSSNGALPSSERNEALPLDFEDHFKFEKIPDDIKGLIYNNKEIFPKGFDEDCLW